MQRIAIVGSGIAGLGAAWLLDGVAEVTVFEAANRAGGHANTVMAGDQPVREFKFKIVDVHVLYRHGSSREGKDTRHRKQDQKLFPFQEHKRTETIRFARC